MKISVVAGAAGLIGSHLCEKLLERGHKVVALDNFVTGQKRNIEPLLKNKNFELHECDITVKSQIPNLNLVDEIYNMASPASPVDFTKIPLFILKTASMGQYQMLELAKQTSARVLFASTSEVYGDPLVHPQVETYLGNVNPIGERGCYDEAKRYGEALSMAHHREHNTNIAIARIFNTYGPRMRPEDGRVIPNFFMQGLDKKGLTVYGDGQQTRSLCYVADMVDGLVALMNSSVKEPVNIGNPIELTILDIAETINKITGNTAPHDFKPLPKDDPKQRCPDITRAKELLNWQPKVSLEEGLRNTLEFFKENYF